MSDFDMLLLCHQNENYYCWSSMIMSSYFNVQYLHQKMIRIYADIVQNHTLPGVFPNFWRGSTVGRCSFPFTDHSQWPVSSKKTYSLNTWSSVWILLRAHGSDMRWEEKLYRAFAGKTFISLRKVLCSPEKLCICFQNILRSLTIYKLFLQIFLFFFARPQQTLCLLENLCILLKKLCVCSQNWWWKY